jgi:hypothetical protein
MEQRRIGSNSLRRWACRYPMARRILGEAHDACTMWQSIAKHRSEDESDASDTLEASEFSMGNSSCSFCQEKPPAMRSDPMHACQHC